MFECAFCENEKTETWTGKWCPTCRKLKNLGNCYSFEELYNICERVCIRSDQQRTNKINQEIKNQEIKKEEKWVKKV